MLEVAGFSLSKSMVELNKLYNENCLDTMSRMPDGFVDLTVTSPPYDNLRNYNGYTFDFEPIAKELFRVTKQGGVVVWVVGDATVNGSETGTSFRQALGFKDIGFNLHDTMIWNKGAFSAVGALQVRYAPVFEYMFICSKGAPVVFRPIKDRQNKTAGRGLGGSTVRNADGTTKPVSNPNWITPDFGQRHNVWEMPAEMDRNVTHPAPFPEELVADHIKSWSNPDDIVYDPFMGSGTTAKAAHLLGRQWIGSEISAEYCEIANKRLERYLAQVSLFR